MFGFQTPFPALIPYPVRWQDGEMEPESICMDGTVISVRYKKRESGTRAWYDRAAIHEIHWYAELHTEKDVVDHFRGEHPKAKKIDKTKLARCGAGYRIRLRQTRPAIAGGNEWIYLISENGDCGALRLKSNAWQRYPLAKFRIGSAGQWPELPTLTQSPALVRKIDPNS